jgi:hypothetical protein
VRGATAGPPRDWAGGGARWAARGADQMGRGRGGKASGRSWAMRADLAAGGRAGPVSHPGFRGPKPGREHNHQVCWYQVSHI